MKEHEHLLQQILPRYGLTGASATPLGSYNHRIYRIDGADQQRYSLRICGFPTMQRRPFEDEMIWLDFVARRNPRLAPRPIANDQGDMVMTVVTPEGERLSCLFAWIEGEDLRSAVTPLHLRKMGRIAAELHNIAREFPFPDANSDFRSGYRYDQSLMHSHYDWIEKHQGTIGAENVTLLHQAIEYVVAAMDRMGTTPANYGMIHADMSFGNWLEHEGEIYPIDFEQLGRGHFLYDLAVLWSELREHQTDVVPLWQSFVTGYGEVADLPFRQEEELQPFVVALQLNFIDWFYNSMQPTVQVEMAPRMLLIYEAIRQQLSRV